MSPRTPETTAQPAPRLSGQLPGDFASDIADTKEHQMDHHALLLHTLMHRTTVDSPERARRRAELTRFETEARAARRRRRRERMRRAADAVIAFHGRRTPEADLREALR